MKALIAIVFVTLLLSHLSAIAQRFSAKNATLGTDVWRTAEGILPGRMLAPAAKGDFPLYRTVWKREQGNFLVCLRYPGLELFGTPYDVAILSTNMQIVRHGEITAYQDDTPYCIAEVMSDDKELPDGLRGRWLLAVGFWENHFQERQRIMRANGATNSADSFKVALETLPSGFYFELVRWNDDPVQPKYGAGNLLHVSNLQVHWIEQGLSILSQARQSRRKA
jgi:hypothetical protein